MNTTNENQEIQKTEKNHQVIDERIDKYISDHPEVWEEVKKKDIERLRRSYVLKLIDRAREEFLEKRSVAQGVVAKKWLSRQPADVQLLLLEKAEKLALPTIHENYYRLAYDESLKGFNEKKESKGEEKEPSIICA